MCLYDSYITDLLQLPRSTVELLDIKDNHHPYLPLLIPEFYQSDRNYTINPFVFVDRGEEITEIFSRLQSLVSDIAHTLATPSDTLRERSLKMHQTKLAQLYLELPSFNIPSQSVIRWQRVLTHWQRLLELELEEQRNLSE